MASKALCGCDAAQASHDNKCVVVRQRPTRPILPGGRDSRPPGDVVCFANVEKNRKFDLVNLTKGRA